MRLEDALKMLLAMKEAGLKPDEAGLADSSLLLCARASSPNGKNEFPAIRLFEGFACDVLGFDHSC